MSESQDSRRALVAVRLATIVDYGGTHYYYGTVATQFGSPNAAHKSH